jgi:hypothetical protein
MDSFRSDAATVTSAFIATGSGTCESVNNQSLISWDLYAEDSAPNCSWSLWYYVPTNTTVYVTTLSLA